MWCALFCAFCLLFLRNCLMVCVIFVGSFFCILKLNGFGVPIVFLCLSFLTRCVMSAANNAKMRSKNYMLSLKLFSVVPIALPVNGDGATTFGAGVPWSCCFFFFFSNFLNAPLPLSPIPGEVPPLELPLL